MNDSRGHDDEPVGDIIDRYLAEMQQGDRARVEEFLGRIPCDSAQAAPAPIPDIPGYRIEAELGRGGFSVVYLARDQRVGRHVALKVLESGAVPDADRFDEARKLAAVEHPNIVRVHSVGEIGERYYLDMERIDGPTIEQLIEDRGGRLPLREAIGIARDVVRALNAVHQQGLVHRDLKPSNVMLTADGSIKLMDLGIARPVESQTPNDPVAVLGTPAYMAPEQYLGRAVDHRADLFSLGALVYEMLTGSRPFPGTDPSELREQILHHPPVPVLSHRDAPAPVVDLIEKLLAKDPSQRLQSAGEVDQALSRLQAGDRERPAMRRRTWIFAALSLMLLASVVWWLGSASDSRSSPPIQVKSLVLEVQRGLSWAPVTKGMKLRTGDRFRLRWHADVPCFVYVWTESRRDQPDKAYYALFPDPRSKSQNPLPPDRDIALPRGRSEASSAMLAWELGPPAGAQRVFVEASTEPQPHLERALEAMSQTEYETGDRGSGVEDGSYLGARSASHLSQLRDPTKVVEVSGAPEGLLVRRTERGVAAVLEFEQVD